MTASGVRLVRTNVRGSPVGESHGRARFADHLVALAHAMRRDGYLLREIADEVGCSRATVHDWLTGRRRKPHQKVIVKRGPARGRLTSNRQPGPANAATARPAADTIQGDTVAPTVKDVQP